MTAINPLNYSFNDGRNTLTNLNSTAPAFSVGTDGSGNIDEWIIVLFADFPSMDVGQQRKSIGMNNLDTGQTLEIVNDAPLGINVDGGATESPGGSWVVTTAVPEPSSLLLFASGAGLLPLFMRRRRN